MPGKGLIILTMTRNKGLIVALCAQAAISAASSSAALASLASEKVVAGVALISAMLSAGTAVYVALTGEKVPPIPPTPDPYPIGSGRAG